MHTIETYNAVWVHVLIRRGFRYFLVFMIVVFSLIVTIRLFDWHGVWHALGHMRVGVLLGGGLPILFAIFALRGLRWLVVLGIKPTVSRFWRSFCANGAASGLASLTPFQLGEVIKIRLIPDYHGGAWRQGVSALLVERVMDLSGVLGMGLCGLAIHFQLAYLSLLAILFPLVSGFVLALLSSHIHRLPQRMQPYMEAFRHVRQIVYTSLLTIPIWLLYTGLWWVAALAMNISLSFSQTATLLGGVTLAVVASMTPGGLGVAELGSRGIMIWLGASTNDAETTAIAMRMITPLGVAAGSVCLLVLIRFRRK